MIELCRKITISRLIMSVHLNDNDISFDSNYMLEILDIFGMSKKDIPLVKYDGREKMPQKIKSKYFDINFKDKYKLNLNENL